MPHDPAEPIARLAAEPASSAERVAHLPSSLAGLSAALGEWIDGDLASGDIAELARRIAGSATGDRPFETLLTIFGGRDAAASTFVEDQPAGLQREAARLAAALSLSSIDRPAARTLIQASDDGSESHAVAILYCELGGGWRPEDIAVLEAAQAGPLADRAIVARLNLTRSFGPDPASFRAATLAAIGYDGPAGRMERLAADNVWLAGDWAMAQPLLGRFSGLCALAGTVPAIADLARRAAWHRVPMADRPAARGFVDAIRALKASSESFWKGIADRSVRIAVVGNSPCETGLGKGAEIDGHDIVVRFNDAPEGGEFAADYGARCDVRAFAKRSVARWAQSEAKTIVMTRQDGMLARGMEVPRSVLAEGRAAAFVPGEEVRALRRELGAAPSTGLIMLNRLRRLRGSLDGVSCYGFSLTDQVGEEATSAHYFAETAAHRSHAWDAERALLDQWLNEKRAGR